MRAGELICFFDDGAVLAVNNSRVIPPYRRDFFRTAKRQSAMYSARSAVQPLSLKEKIIFEFGWLYYSRSVGRLNYAEKA